MKICVRSIPFHGHNVEVPAEIPSVYSRQWKAVPVIGQKREKHLRQTIWPRTNRTSYASVYPKPAIGSQPTPPCLDFSSISINFSGGISAVVNRYVHTFSISDLGMPPPSSDIFKVTSSFPSAITTLTGGMWTLFP
uniref:Uncharacterized protein n=1 Tax=Rhodosorus marinus TaxID=101924 RepID=A0A7S2ZPP5_9RHOD